MKHFSVKMLSMLMLLFIGFGAVSCSDKDEPGTNPKETPKVSFERQTYNLGTDEVEVRVKASFAPETNINIPLAFDGAATEGVDFTVSSKSVTIKAGETTGSFTVKGNGDEDNLGDDNKEFIINLGEGSGYELGLVNYANFTLLGKSGYVLSFDSANARINTDQTFKLNVSPMSGWTAIQAPETFTLEIDPELSTAQEGVHFSIDKTVTVEAKKRFGEFTVKLLKFEEGKDVVVVRVQDKSGFAPGSNPVLTIKLAGPDNFTGTWAFKEWVNSTLAEMYGEDMSIAPKFNADDKLTFEGATNAEYTFTPALTGDLKNYFGNDSRKVTLSGMEQYLYQEGMSSSWPTLSVLKVPGVNIKFSANANETREVKVGFRIIEVDNQEVLEVVIDDFEPVKDEFYSMSAEFMIGMDLDDNHPADPTHPCAWFPYQLHFVRVK